MKEPIESMNGLAVTSNIVIKYLFNVSFEPINQNLKEFHHSQEICYVL